MIECWKRLLLWKCISILPVSPEEKCFWQSVFYLFHFIMHIDIYPGTSAVALLLVLNQGSTSPTSWLQFSTHPPQTCLVYVLCLFFKLTVEARRTGTGWKHKIPEHANHKLEGKWKPFASFSANRRIMSSPTWKHRHTQDIYPNSKTCSLLWTSYETLSTGLHDLLLWRELPLTYISTIPMPLLIWTCAVCKMVCKRVSFVLL